MKFQYFGEFFFKFLGEMPDVEASNQKDFSAKVQLRFPDIHRVKVYFADPRDPFERTVALIDNMHITFHLPVYEFESLIDRAIHQDLFSKMSLN